VLTHGQLGPVKLPPKSRYQELVKQHAGEQSSEDDDDDNDATLSSASEDMADSEQADDDEEESENDTARAAPQESAVGGAQERSNKKRKRGAKDDDVEDVYMQKIAREEAKDEEERKKKRKTKPVGADEGGEADESDDQESFTIPKHETLAGADGNDDEVEKAARTVFLGNVSNEAITSKSAEKQLKQHLSSFIADLADNKPPHKVESIRFRSTAFAGALPKRAAFAKKEIMDSTTKSTNAYVVYSTKIAAREAAKRLNGTVILGRHLRVDSIAHPAKVDHRRCVFVGNLGFVDDTSKLPTDDDKEKKKNKPPGDVEEGLWVQFSKAGKVESVRVPRDAKTRVSKGFAYVQFEDENAVEAALQFNDQKYPPLLPRKLRVTRARAQKKKEKKPAGPPPSKSDDAKPKGAYNAKISAEEKSQRGRAGAMLNKAAKFKTAESFVFEGHRASSKQGKSGLKLGAKTAKKGPNGRKSRSKAWSGKK
jgi:nucleolar protein 12